MVRKVSFCMINIINRMNHAENISSKDSNIFRWFCGDESEQIGVFYASAASILWLDFSAHLLCHNTSQKYPEVPGSTF